MTGGPGARSRPAEGPRGAILSFTATPELQGHVEAHGLGCPAPVAGHLACVEPWLQPLAACQAGMASWLVLDVLPNIMPVTPALEG